MKRCTKCGVVKLKEEFYRAAGNRDGLKGSCHKCSSAATIEWNRTHPAQRAAWRAANTARIRNQGKAWMAAHPEARRSMQKKWRAKNAETLRQYQRERRARKHRAFVERVYVKVVFARDGGRCGICHRSINRAIQWPSPESLVLDHIIPLTYGGEHSYRNIQLAHLGCNSRKNNTGSGQPRLIGVVP